MNRRGRSRIVPRESRSRGYEHFDFDKKGLAGAKVTGVPIMVGWLEERITGGTCVFFLFSSFC